MNDSLDRRNSLRAGGSTAHPDGLRGRPGRKRSLAAALARVRHRGRVAAEAILLIALLLFLLARPFVLEPFYIPSGSMLPLLSAGDRILVNKLSYHWGEPGRGEVVVFYGSASFGSPDEIYVKRIIALPGEEVSIMDGETYIEGRPLPETYLRSRPYSDFGPAKVPLGSYFVMGDNRNDSRDSRYWGAVSRESLIGHAVCVFWPSKHLCRLP